MASPNLSLRSLRQIQICPPMNSEIVELHEDLSRSPLYSEDLAPVPADKRTWNMWHIAFLWVGMAVCIPTYMLASMMITSGLSWVSALIIIALANIVITIPMVLNGHSGLKYGIPFPVLGRSSFGTKGIHLPSLLRAIVACGWFGIQTWVGGGAIYSIYRAASGISDSPGLDSGDFVCFGIFWFINMYFVWKGTESIKWLEVWSAPILILIGILLIAWGVMTAGGFGVVLDQSKQLEKLSAFVENGHLVLNPIRTKEGEIKADEFQLTYPDGRQSDWMPIAEESELVRFAIPAEFIRKSNENEKLNVQLRVVAEKFENQNQEAGNISKNTEFIYSGTKPVSLAGTESPNTPDIWTYILWFTAMVGFWATMSISIADITRYAKTQKDQIRGQFIGLPGTMMLYSFVGIFVTCAAIVNFDDILIAEDAPWDPVALLSKFKEPWVVIVAQIMMLIATLSTNIAANVIAPANVFCNFAPKSINFKTGGTIAGIVGILICPWWIMDEVAGLLIFVSGLLGPVVGIMLADYFLIRKKKVYLSELYRPTGIYSYSDGWNVAASFALIFGVGAALIGMWVDSLSFLYDLAWFSGFGVAFFSYWFLMRKNTPVM